MWRGQDSDLSTVPCYAFARRLDESMMAPFLRRAGEYGDAPFLTKIFGTMLFDVLRC